MLISFLARAAMVRGATFARRACSSARSLRRRVLEHADAIPNSAKAHELAQLLEFGVRFAGVADDERRAEKQARNARAQPLDELA